jgi:hypothetical protein
VNRASGKGRRKLRNEFRKPWERTSPPSIRFVNESEDEDTWSLLAILMEAPQLELKVKLQQERKTTCNYRQIELSCQFVSRFSNKKTNQG